MKNLKFVMLTLVLCLSCALTFAQSSTKYISRNNDEHVAQVRTTADATPVYIDSVKLQTNETGVLEVTVIGYQKDTAYSVRGKLAVDFNKRRGTLTVGTATADIPIVTDAALGSATFAIVSVNNNLYIRVTGKAATSIRWYSVTKVKSQATVL